MQAELEVKPGKRSFFATHIRPALVRLVHPRRKSYWNVELEDETEPGAFSDVSGLLSQAAGILILGIAQSLFIVLPALYVVQIVFVAPGGLAGVIGQHMADICLSGGSCDPGVLLGSYAFAAIILANIFLLFAYSMLASNGYFDRDDGRDVVLGLAVVDERVKLLHDELIAAKVLPEPAEYTDDAE